MITKSELQNAHRAMLDEERARIGEPPTAEELLAYSRGELSHEDEERIAGLLACYPELARGIAEPIPAAGANPGEAGYVSDAELAERWTMIRDQLPQRTSSEPRGRVLQFWRIASGIAAALAVAFGAMLWQARSALGEPRVAGEQQMLLPDRTRGAETETPPTVSTHDDTYVIVTPVTTEQPFAQYRVEIVDESSRSLWKSAPLAAPANGNVAIVVPRTFLEPGRYRVVLSGVAATGEEKLETYSMRVAR